MAELPFIPIFPDAWMLDTLHLNMEEVGAYFTLIQVAWKNPDGLADDDKALATYTRMGVHRWRTRVKPRVMKFWTLRDGMWTQKRLEKERKFAQDRATVSRNNGARGGRPKLLKNNEPENPAGFPRVSSGFAKHPENITQKKQPNPTQPIKKKDPPLSPSFGSDTAWLNEKGEIELSDHERQYWLTRFGDDERLSLALVAAAPYVQENSRAPLLKQVRAHLARAAGEKLDRDKRHASAVKANAPRPKGSPPKNFNFSNYTVHDTQDNSDPVKRYADNTPEFMAEVERLYQEGLDDDAEVARERGWVKLKHSECIGRLSEGILKRIPYDNVSKRMFYGDKLAAKE